MHEFELLGTYTSPRLQLVSIKLETSPNPRNLAMAKTEFTRLRSFTDASVTDAEVAMMAISRLQRRENADFTVADTLTFARTSGISLTPKKTP